MVRLASGVSDDFVYGIVTFARVYRAHISHAPVGYRLIRLRLRWFTTLWMWSAKSRCVAQSLKKDPRSIRASWTGVMARMVALRFS